MKLDKPNTDKIIIIMSSMFLVFGMVLLFTNRFLTRENVKKVLKNENILELVRDNKDINLVLTNNRIPKTVLNNITKKDINNIVDKAVDRMYVNKKILEKEDIEILLRNAINKYERKNRIDIYSNISVEISKVAGKISDDVNSSSSLEYFYTMKEMSYFYILFIVFALAGLIILSLVEKYNGITIDGLIISLSTIVTYYIVNSGIYDIIEQLEFISNNNKVLKECVNSTLSTLCGIVFIIGVIILIFSSTKLMDKGLRDFRMRYLYGYK
jgi:hypothetical protein